jgi:hypothetical protein
MPQALAYRLEEDLARMLKFTIISDSYGLPFVIVTDFAIRYPCSLSLAHKVGCWPALSIILTFDKYLHIDMIKGL